MRMLVSLCIFGLAALSAGCELVHIAAHNLAYGSALRTNQTLTCVRDQRLTNEAWSQARRATPGQTYSKDYARGFKAGFSAYLDQGGGVGAPPLPARRYWGLAYRSPCGQEAVRDWFAGFQHGVTAARDSGYRELAIVPSATGSEGPPFPPGPGIDSMHPPARNEAAPWHLIEPVLPLPRSIPSASGAAATGGPAAAQG